MTKLLLSLSAVLLLSGCASMFTPRATPDPVAAVDSSTPTQYPQQNNGFIGYHDTKGWVLDGHAPVGSYFGVLTPNKRAEYNNLIHDYAVQFRAQYKHALVADQGLSPWIDAFGNSLWAMKPDSVTDLGYLEAYKRRHLPADTLLQKAGL